MNNRLIVRRPSGVSPLSNEARAARATRQSVRHWTPEEIAASRSRYYQYGERDPINGVRGRDWDYPEAKGA